MVVLWLACLSVGMAAKRCFPHPGGFETFKWVPSLTQPELLELRQYRPLWLLYCRLWGKMEEGGDARRSCFPGHPIDLYKKVDIQSKNLYSKTIMGGAIIFFGRGGAHPIKEFNTSWSRASPLVYVRYCVLAKRAKSPHPHPPNTPTPII